MLGQHHLHTRKRIHQNLEPYPHPDRATRIIDWLVYVGGIITGPVLTLPQLLKIWIGGSTAGVSLTTWSAFVIGSALWLAYGGAYPPTPIIGVIAAPWAGVVAFASLL